MHCALQKQRPLDWGSHAAGAAAIYGAYHIIVGASMKNVLLTEFNGLIMTKRVCISL
jgi:hypothetical protein